MISQSIGCLSYLAPRWFCRLIGSPGENACLSRLLHFLLVLSPGRCTFYDVGSLRCITVEYRLVICCLVIKCSFRTVDRILTIIIGILFDIGRLSPSVEAQTLSIHYQQPPTTGSSILI